MEKKEGEAPSGEEFQPEHFLKIVENYEMLSFHFVVKVAISQKLGLADFLMVCTRTGQLAENCGKKSN